MYSRRKIISFIIALALSVSPVFADDSINPIWTEQEMDIVLPQDEPENVIPVFEPLNTESSEVIFKQITKRYDSIDPATSGSYPGGRGPNKLIIYTSNFGEHTGTNEFGTEAIVEGNVVTSLSGADSAIPEDGVVISGHGIAKNWINQNITVGSKIYINKVNKTITVYTTSESYTYEARKKIDDALSIMNYYQNSMPSYSPVLAQGHIQTARNYMQMAHNSLAEPNVLKQYSQNAISSANMAIKTSLPYLEKELKGVWIRPTEYSEEQISSTLDKLKDSGFNNIFLETYYHGKTIFPSNTMNKYGFTVQNEQFVGFNPLEVWIKEAHKRDIKVHTWFQSFYVGNQNPAYNETSILAVHPEWGNKTKKCADCQGVTVSAAEHNGYFLDPANPEVQTFLKELVTEIITEYKPDGINLDYIRYPNSNPRCDSGAWGFSEYARNDFKNIYGKDPAELTISDAMWYDWNNYRRNIITSFVRQIGQIGKENHTYISAVIFPDIASALATKQQDWRSWSMNGYIDGFTPLFLTYDSKMLSSMMRDVMSVKAPETELYAGLFVTFMGGSSEDLIRQIFETRKMNANGVILFDYAHTTPVYTSTLMASAFNGVNSVAQTKVAQKKKKSKKQSKIRKSSSSPTKSSKSKTKKQS